MEKKEFKPFVPASETMAELTVYDSIDIMGVDITTLLVAADPAGDTWVHDHRVKLILTKATSGAVRFRFVEQSAGRFGYVGNWVMQMPGIGTLNTPIPDPARFSRPDGRCVVEYEDASNMGVVAIREAMASKGEGQSGISDW